MKLDFTQLLPAQSPATTANTRDSLRKDFTERLGNPATRLSSYRCTKALKLDYAQSKEQAQKFREKFSTLLVLGTGGSTLGAKAILDCLGEKVDRKVLFLENLDASDLPQLSAPDLKVTGVVAISKSGNTLETLLTLSLFEDLYRAADLNLKDHFIIITDAGSKATLSNWAEQNDVASLAMDQKLGGRYSVTSAVGIFPLAFAGLDTDSFFNGVEKIFHALPCDANLDFALSLCAREETGVIVHALWVYASKLKELGAWWRQLWSESLGKTLDGKSYGQFAIACVGSVDQHSVLQQLTQGKPVALSGFITVAKTKSEITTNLTPIIQKKFPFAEGKTWTDIRNKQSAATRQALNEAHRPTYQIELTDLSENSIGELMAFWMDTVALVGIAQKINPFNQPGVERAKVIFPTLF